MSIKTVHLLSNEGLLIYLRCICIYLNKIKFYVVFFLITNFNLMKKISHIVVKQCKYSDVHHLIFELKIKYVIILSNELLLLLLSFQDDLRAI